MPYYRIASLLKAAARVPVVLDDSLLRLNGRSPREAARHVQSMRHRVSMVVSAIPATDMEQVERIAVRADRDEPVLKGAELVVGPDPTVESLLELFGHVAYRKLEPERNAKWMQLYQREANGGKRIVTASGPEARFVKAYVVFHMKPKELRTDSQAMYDFMEDKYGKRYQQWMFAY